MGWSKRDVVVQAFEEIGLSESDLSAEQLQSGMRKLDAMMAFFNARGIRLGYPIPSTANGGDLADPTNLKDEANEAVYTNLAIRLGSAIGRQVSMELKAIAKQGYDSLLARAALPPEVQLPSGTLAGAGNKGRVVLADPTSSIDAGPDSKLEFE